MIIENEYIKNDISNVFFDDFFTVKVEVLEPHFLEIKAIIDKKELDYTQQNFLYTTNAQQYFILFKKENFEDTTIEEFDDFVFSFKNKKFRLQNVEDDETGILRADVIWI